jgi:small neutral amino acid transporter SnatA (MarC family)
MQLLNASMLLLVLLNPFLVIVYQTDVVQKLSYAEFCAVLMRAVGISVGVFWGFALLGDAIFSRVIQAQFASFQIFGGIVLFAIGLQFVFRGTASIETLRGESKHLAGAIAMPVMIGPGTISASVIIGERLDPLPACAAILMAVIASAAIMMGLKKIHDFVRPRNEPLVERYIEIAGRITALYVGTVAVEMVMSGIKHWTGGA